MSGPGEGGAADGAGSGAPSGPEAGTRDQGDRGAPITLVLADDHRVVRAGLRLLLDAQPDLQVVAEAGDLAECERQVVARQPRVLVLDLGMPDGSGLSSISRLLELAPGTRIVVLTMRDDATAARQALRAGATAYIVKESAEAELIEAVRQAAAGRTYLTPRIGARLAAGPGAPGTRVRRPGLAGDPGDQTGRLDELTARELEVLRLIALGHTNGEIAERLLLSVRTIESHRAHIQRKTHNSTRAELVAYAQRHGLA